MKIYGVEMTGVSSVTADLRHDWLVRAYEDATVLTDRALRDVRA